MALIIAPVVTSAGEGFGPAETRIAALSLSFHSRARRIRYVDERNPSCVLLDRTAGIPNPELRFSSSLDDCWIYAGLSPADPGLLWLRCKLGLSHIRHATVFSIRLCRNGDVS